MESIPCPKCSSSTTLEISERDVTLVCRCGYRKVMHTLLEDGIQVEHLFDSKLVLPRKGTKMLACLGALASLPTGSTADVLEELLRRGEQWSPDDVASFLTALKHRGLVRTLVVRRGISGGSDWALTEFSATELGITI